MKKTGKYVVLLIVVGLFFAMTGSAFAKDTTGSAAGTAAKKSANTKNGFVTKSGRTYYYRNGKLLTGKKKIDGKYYYFYPRAAKGKKKGEMATGWVDIGKARYFFYKSGKTKGQAALGWVTSGKKKYYFQPSGSKVGQLYTGLKTIGKYTYYFSTAKNSKGRLLTGLQTVNGKTYYFAPTGSGEKLGAMQTGQKTINGKKYIFLTSGKNKGQAYTGWKTINKKKYYFGSDGAAVTGWQVIGNKTYYFKSNGVLTNKVLNNVLASDSCGTMKQKTLWRAQVIVSQIIKPSMTKNEKIWACFNYVARTYDGKLRPRTPHYTGMDWPEIYANDMFINGIGNCCSYAAAFAYLVKACGYEVYACNSTGHGWAEIDGKIYDPEVYHRQLKTLYYATPYSALPDYAGVQRIWLSDPKRYAFMHIKL